MQATPHRLLTLSPFERPIENSTIGINRKYGSSRMLFSEYIESRENLNKIMERKPQTYKPICKIPKPMLNTLAVKPNASSLILNSGRQLKDHSKSFDGLLTVNKTPLIREKCRSIPESVTLNSNRIIALLSNRFNNSNKLVNRLLLCLKKMAMTKHDITTTDYKKLFPTKEYQLRNTRKFIECIRKNDLLTAKAYIEEDPYIVYQYDTVN